jgi:hypothetical protein
VQKRQSEDQIFEALLGIPNVHPLSVDEDETGLRVEVETTITEAVCPQCGQPAVATGRRAVELDSAKPFRGRPFHLTWQTRGWSCQNPACATGEFFEKADWQFSAG